MSPKEIAKIAGIGAGVGIRKVKITGGEPLLREDIVDVVRGIGGQEISITTNGILLEPIAGELARAGLKRINIGCESTPRFEKIRGGLEAAQKAGLPVKLNMVVMKGVNENEVGAMLRLCREHGATLQLIELIKTDSNREFYLQHHISLGNIEREIANHAKSCTSRSLHARNQYKLDGVGVEIVRPMHNTHFCGNCTRIRVTSNGLLKPCLMKSDNCVDLLSAIRAGRQDKELETIFAQACRARAPYWQESAHAD